MYNIMYMYVHMCIYCSNVAAWNLRRGLWITCQCEGLTYLSVRVISIITSCREKIYKSHSNTQTQLLQPLGRGVCRLPACEVVTRAQKES